jgi:hypothetical protein
MRREEHDGAPSLRSLLLVGSVMKSKPTKLLLENQVLKLNSTASSKLYEMKWSCY